MGSEYAPAYNVTNIIEYVTLFKKITKKNH